MSTSFVQLPTSHWLVLVELQLESHQRRLPRSLVNLASKSLSSPLGSPSIGVALPFARACTVPHQRSTSTAEALGLYALTNLSETLQGHTKLPALTTTHLVVPDQALPVALVAAPVLFWS